MQRKKSSFGKAARRGDGGAPLTFEQMVFAALPSSSSQMKRFAAAAALLIGGKRGRDMSAPEPIVQAGYEPGEDEMALIVAAAQKEGRDLIHVSCHCAAHGRPTGLIAVVYFEDGRARPHRRASLICAPGSTRVVLAGVSDIEDEVCHFVFRPGGKMTRVAGLPLDDLAAGIERAGYLWLERAALPDLADCSDENIRVYNRVQTASF